MRYLLAVDLGGTNLRVALADDAGTIHHEVRVPTMPAEGLPPSVLA